MYVCDLPWMKLTTQMYICFITLKWSILAPLRGIAKYVALSSKFKQLKSCNELNLAVDFICSYLLLPYSFQKTQKP